MTEMVLPGLGMGMTDGTITAWHKAPGDWIGTNEPLCDVEAAKTTLEVFAPKAGYLVRILVPAGSNVPVNTVIAIIADEAGMLSDTPDAAAAPPQTSPPGAPSSVPAAPPPASVAITPDRPGQGSQVEPRARRAARERGLDLAQIAGSGPGGRITEEDVLRAAQAGAASVLAAGNRKSGVFHQLRMRCDASPLFRLLDGIAEAQRGCISPTAVIVRAAALALAEAGLDNPAIGLRLPDDSLRVTADPATLSARTIDAVMAGSGDAASPVLAIEALSDDGLDEIVRIDPAGPPSLCIGAFPPGGDGTWRFTLTFGEGAMDIAGARRFLMALRDLLGRPLAILL